MISGTGTGLKQRVWLDFIPYANRLFAAGREDIWSNADTFISNFSHWQGLLRSDILSIPLYDFYADWINENMDLLQTWAGKKATFSLKKLLAAEKPRKEISDVLIGLHNLYKGAQPFVLRFPSPQKWLQLLHPMVRPGQELMISEEDIEVASMHLAEYLRNFSSHGLSAIVMEENNQLNMMSNQVCTLYQPVFNLAKHYQWSVGIHLEESVDESLEITDKIDFYLFGNSDFTTLLHQWEKGNNIGGGLNRDFWSKQQVLPERLQAKFMYGEVPEDAEPETVLSQLKWLR
ncbi:MAG TPA: hypothetical protein DDY49_12030 [Paenibacillaceae bacterium]|nr:hypothetical protein [Paenibacillaceae bacterium]